MYRTEITANGHVLEHGFPKVGLFEQVSKIKRESVRPCDLEELDDALISIGYSADEIEANFGVLLGVGVGMGVAPGKLTYYAITQYGEMPVDERIMFLATLGVNRGPVAELRGFGIVEGYTHLSKREIYTSILYLIDQVATDLHTVHKQKYAICHVKANNHETLKMWRWLGRTLKDVRIGINDNPWDKSYKLVTMNVEGRA